MKKEFFVVALLLVATTSLKAQFSRLHVKAPSGATVGITTGNTAKVIGLIHDGSAGIISTTTLDGTSNNSPLKFATAGQTRMVIFENGYVGIGVSGMPTAELTVGGKIHAREVKVNVNAGAPDYVFLENYRLLPLREVSLYINQHRHLPEVPPATEMEKDGINVSEMNMLLLKKIEELTLYMIDQDKKMELLTTEIEILKKELEALGSK
jgi:hypothetical protein